MQCPVCENTALQMTDRQGVEIDYCPKCRGIWLDRGELDKIIERSNEYQQAPTQSSHQREYQQQSSHEHHKQKPYKKKSGMSFLGDMFDF